MTSKIYTCSNLDILEFKKIFSAFSALTSSNLFSYEAIVAHNSKSLRFPKTEALSFIQTAKEISNVTTNFNTDDFLQDCIKAVCLLIEDGLEITFAHRSFQEYFAALFISDLDDVEVQKELASLYFLAFASRTKDILFEINPSLIEKLLIIPNLKILENKIGFEKKISIANYKKFLSYCFQQIEFDEMDFRDYSNIKKERVVSGVMKRMVSLVPSPKKDGFLMAYIYSFTLRNYSSFNRLLTKLSTEGTEKLDSLIRANGIKQTLRISEVIRNTQLIQILAKDKEFGLSLDNLKLVLDINKQLIEKHEQIDTARKENLLKGLLRRR